MQRLVLATFALAALSVTAQEPEQLKIELFLFEGKDYIAARDSSKCEPSAKKNLDTESRDGLPVEWSLEGMRSGG